MISKNSVSHDFVALDIEYADSIQHICQLGLAVVRNLEIVERRVWLMRPPGNRYEERCMRVHGITPEVTADAPTFEQSWPEIWEYLKGEHLWAHNAASVEHPVINKNIRFCEQCFEMVPWINDSMELYCRPDCNGGNGLVQCCMALGIPCDGHHDALADAEMCARIVIAAIEERKPDWSGVPADAEELRKAGQQKRVLRLGEFHEYYQSTSSGEEDVFAELSSTYEGAVPQVIDVFDKGDKVSGGTERTVDFRRLRTGEDSPLYGRKVVLTGIFSYDRKDLEGALAGMGAKKVAQPSRATDAVIVGTRNVGFTKLLAIEEQEAKGHHMARIVGDEDLEELLYGDGQKFF